MGANETIVDVGDIELCVETFGVATDPTVLLIGGAASSMDWWEDPFCERIAAAGRHVIRYDTRDTGRSTASPVGAPNYGQADLVADAVALLDRHGVAAAHVVGISMGGGIAQRLALCHADRVASLTLMSTSPGGPGGAGSDDDDLPGMAPHLVAMFAEPQPDPDWTDREASVAAIIDGERAFSGSLPFDENRIRGLAEQILDRTTSIEACMSNHWILDAGAPVRPRLGEIATPTVVLHGSDDPLFPIGHGEALAAAINGARLVPLPGVGHQYPPPQVWNLVIDTIVEHTAPR